MGKVIVYSSPGKRKKYNVASPSIIAAEELPINLRENEEGELAFTTKEFGKHTKRVSDITARRRTYLERKCTNPLIARPTFLLDA